MTEEVKTESTQYNMRVEREREEGKKEIDKGGGGRKAFLFHDIKRVTLATVSLHSTPFE